MDNEQVARVFRELGELNNKIKCLTDKVDDNYTTTTKEHRTVHDIVHATSETMRNISRRLDIIEPLTNDYREQRAEQRGAARIKKAFFAVSASLAGIVGAGFFELLKFITGKGS